MAAYEAERFLGECVESVLNQSYEDFEFVVVDDPSSDATASVLDEYEALDSRVVRIRNREPKGLVGSLNEGLRHCRGDYVVRMDADDVAHPERLARQVEFLDSHPDVGIVGSYYQLLDEDGRKGEVITMPESDLAIRWKSLFDCPFGHPAVAFRRRLVTDHDLRYSEHFPVTEDYDLWTRMLRHTRGANLATPLLFHRRDAGSNRSQEYAREQLRDHDKIAFRTIRDQCPEVDVSLAEVSQLRVLFSGGEAFAPHDPRENPVELLDAYLDLLDAFVGRHPDGPELEAVKRQAVAQSLAFVEFPFGPTDMALLSHLLRRHPGVSKPLLDRMTSKVVERVA